MTINLTFHVVDKEQELNEGQRTAIETALIPDNKLLLVQGPPGKLMHCFI